MLVDRELRFHRRVSQVRQYQVSAETLVIKPHGLGAIAVEQKKRRTTQYCLTSHQCPVVPNNVYIYVSGTANVRPGDELKGCQDGGRDDPNSSRFRLEVIKVPLAKPSTAAIVSSPRIFNNLPVAPRNEERAAIDAAARAAAEAARKEAAAIAALREA